MEVLAGIDIGGTKCAVSLGREQNGTIEMLRSVRFPTRSDDFSMTVSLVIDHLDTLIREQESCTLIGIGIVCGGPLDSEKGLILSPPNLKAWGDVDIVTPLKKHYKIPVTLRNDADACALAEWRLGSGKGYEHMIFLTFGTGMGAGLILNGRLYSGSTNLAGEVGHIRLAEDGPLGHRKRGSFEGFCSGGGIASLGRELALKAIEEGNPPRFCPTLDSLGSISAQSIAQALHEGDPLAQEIYHRVAEALGRGLAILIDILNVPLIVIGSIFVRQEAVIRPVMLKTINEEALKESAANCTIVAASLGEDLGNYAALCTASEGVNNEI